MGIKNELFKIYSKNFYELARQFAKTKLGGNFNENKMRLFNSKTEESVQIKENNIFQCPLCGRYFPTGEGEEIDFNALGLTVEHVPSETMGSLIKTMTCKPCNNFFGSLEGTLEKTLEKKYMWEEEGVTKARLSFKDREKEIGLDVKFNEGEAIHLEAIEEISNKKAIEEMMDKISEGFNFTLHAYLPDVDKRKRTAVLYKNALLIAFYVFGYGYTESPSLQKLRTQILNPEEEIIPAKGTIALNNISEGCNYPLIGWSKQPVKALYVTFPLEIKGDRKLYTVPLPGPGPEEVFDSFISKLSSRTSGEEVNFKLHFPYEVPTGNSLELVKDLGTKVVYRFWQEMT